MYGFEPSWEKGFKNSGYPPLGIFWDTDIRLKLIKDECDDKNFTSNTEGCECGIIIQRWQVSHKLYSTLLKEVENLNKATQARQNTSETK